MNYIKKRTLFLGMLLCLCITTSCVLEKETVKVGVVGTMTGTQSDLSVSGRRGIEIAVEMLNDNGGINGKLIELVVKNDENNGDRAKAIVKEFIEENVEVVIGHYTSGMMLAAYEELLENEILYLSPTVSADQLSEIDDNFIRFIASTKEQAEIVNEVADKNNHKKFAVIYDEKNIGFNESLYANFRTILASSSGEVKWNFGYQVLDDEVYLELIELFKGHDEALDSVFIIGNASDVAGITSKIKKNDINVEIYGSLWAHTNDLLRIGGSQVEGVHVVSGIDYNHESEAFDLFTESYYSRYGKNATFSSMYSYETMMALGEVLREVEYDSKAIKKGIISREFTGLQEDFYVDQSGDNTRNYMMDIVVGSEYKRVD